MLLSLLAHGQDNVPPALGGASSKLHAADEQALRAAWTEAEVVHGADSKEVAVSLNNLGQFYFAKSRYADALPLQQRSLAILEKALSPDHVSVATSLNNLAGPFEAMGRYAEALPLYQRSLAIREKALGPNHVDVATSLNNLALLYQAMGRYAEALPLHQRNLAIREKALGPDHVSVATGLNNLSSLYTAMGRYAEALPLYERSLAILENGLGPDHVKVATSLNNLALLYQAMGRYAEALPLHQRSLAIREKALGPDHPDVATSLNNLATLFQAMGRYGDAVLLLKRSLAIFEKVLDPDHVDVATNLNNLAEVHKNLGHYAVAAQLYQRSLAIRVKALGLDHVDVADSLNNLAQLSEKTGHIAKALPLYQRSLTIREAALGPDHPDVAASLTNIGRNHLAVGAFDSAEIALSKAVALQQSQLGGREILWRTQYALSGLNQRLNQPELAILWGKESVNTIQDLRATLVPLGKDLQSSFLADKRHVYQHLADLLIAQGRLAEAQTVLQMLKEQELQDSLERAIQSDPRTTRIELTGLERERFAKYYELRDQQLELGLERDKLERKQKVGDISQAERLRLHEITGKLLPPLRAAMLQFLEALQKSSAQFAQQEQRRTDPALKLIETNLQKAMQQVQRNDPASAVAALQYVVTDARLSILLSTPGSPPLARQFELSAQSLRQKVMMAREIVSRPPGKTQDSTNQDFLNKPLRELYAQLIAPVEADLKKLGIKTLILVPNDVLRYVPFAALKNGDRYLTEDYNLALFNEAVKREFARTPGATWHPAAMGLTQAVGNLPALPAVRDEVETVAMKSGMTGKAFLDDEFTRATLSSVMNLDFNVLHLASHFEFVPGRPDASRLYLGDRSALTLGDIARDKMRFDRFSLVAFSACETGLGDTDLADGRDMESLGALVQNQGAQAVVATLWKADDKSAATLMALFYRGRSTDKLSKAEALRRAQIQFIAGRAAGRARSHPYFWAPFVLMGDWR